MKKSYKIGLAILIIIVIILLGLLVYNKIRNNIILEDADNVLKIDMACGGYGIDGQELKGKEPNTEYIEIEEGNVFYIDKYTVTKSEKNCNCIGEAIQIKEINENEVELVVNDKLINLKENDEYSFMNRAGTPDGLNYSYVLTFISK